MTPDNLPPARHRSRPVPNSAAEVPPARQAVPASAVPTKGASYDVGYGKPPVHSRFQKGQSGNPKGRKKGSRNLDKLVLDLLDERIAVNTPAGRRNVPRIEMLLRKLIELGGKGNARAIDQVLRHYALAQTTAAPPTPSGSDAVHDVTEADTLSLTLLRDIFLAEAAAAEGGVS